MKKKSCGIVCVKINQLSGLLPLKLYNAAKSSKKLTIYISYDWTHLTRGYKTQSSMADDLTISIRLGLSDSFSMFRSWTSYFWF